MPAHHDMEHVCLSHCHSVIQLSDFTKEQPTESYCHCQYSLSKTVNETSVPVKYRHCFIFVKFANSTGKEIIIIFNTLFRKKDKVKSQTQRKNSEAFCLFQEKWSQKVICGVLKIYILVFSHCVVLTFNEWWKHTMLSNVYFTFKNALLLGF